MQGIKLTMTLLVLEDGKVFIAFDGNWIRRLKTTERLVRRLQQQL